MEQKLRRLLDIISPFDCPCSYHGIKMHLERSIFGWPMDIWHANVRGTDVFLSICIRKGQSPVIILESKSFIKEADDEEFYPLFDQCKAAFPSVYDEPLFLSAYGAPLHAFNSYIASQETKFSKNENFVHQFYMNPEQQEKVMELSSLSEGLPEGYHFDQVDLEKDAEVITNTWPHSGPAELLQTKLKLQYGPYALVRLEDEAVAFEISSPFGSQNHLFVFEAHRRKGLGRAVERKLSKGCIQAGNIPFKYVEISKEAVLEWSNKDPLWTRKDDEHGNPIVTVFTSYNVIDE
uniref:Glycine N-acyltransferase-like protein n=1 Tax=Steinernema glaseri TaxID=37863 RepID=A0A1I7Z5N7_9BILA